MNVSRDDFAVIDCLDLGQVKAKLMHKASGRGWSRERADAAEREYRRFLYVVKKYPNEVTAPSLEVDRFWHQHILDTVKYARDCDAVFGYFLHHHPYLGLGLHGDDSAAQRRAGERMRELYADTFGMPAPHADVAFCTVTTKSGFCTVAADPAFCNLAETAFCTVAETAFCTVAETAFCTVAARPAPDAITGANTFRATPATASKAEPAVNGPVYRTRPGKRGQAGRMH